MYAQRFADGPRFRPASLGAAIAINGAFIAALLLANPTFIPKEVRDPTVIFNVPEPEPTSEPKPLPRTAAPRPQPTAEVVTPDPKIKPFDPSPDTVKGSDVIRDPTGPATGPGTDPTTLPTQPPIPPAFFAARQDSRYLADFQPPYPDFERDAGREGIVRLRIRIGVDGRVKQAERLDGRDSFARVAIAHALAKWRFKPATRGGVPEESAMVMTVRFTLDN